MNTSPSLGTAKPATHDSVVVLPEPDGPSSVRNSPGRALSVMPSTARVAPKVLTSPSMRTSAPRAKVPLRPGRAIGTLQAIDEAAHVRIGAGELGDAGAIELLDRGAALAPLARGVEGWSERRVSVTGLDPAVLPGVAFDAMTADHVEDEIGCASDDLGQARATLGAQQRL